MLSRQLRLLHFCHVVEHFWQCLLHLSKKRRCARYQSQFGALNRSSFEHSCRKAQLAGSYHEKLMHLLNNILILWEDMSDRLVIRRYRCHHDCHKMSADGGTTQVVNSMNELNLKGTEIHDLYNSRRETDSTVDSGLEPKRRRNHAFDSVSPFAIFA